MTEANRRMPQDYSPKLSQRSSDDLLASLGSSDDVAPIDITMFGRKTAEIIAGVAQTSGRVTSRFQSSRELAGLLDRRRPQARRALWNQFEQLEYDSVALATLFTGIGLVALLVLSI
jgi:hypothetical protein